MSAVRTAAELPVGAVVRTPLGQFGLVRKHVDGKVLLEYCDAQGMPFGGQSDRVTLAARLLTLVRMPAVPMALPVNYFRGGRRHEIA